MDQKNNSTNSNYLTFGGHLEVFRRMLFRVLAVTLVLAIIVFCFKEQTFNILMAPSHWDFITYRWIEDIMKTFDSDFHFEQFKVNMIATDLSSQFMTHITTALYIGLLGASPYVLYELFRFVSPALYDNERRYAVKIVTTIYVLFIIGVLLTYYILFPVSFRFLGTYSVSDEVVSNITLDSYVSTFTSLTLVMGLVFQLPVIAFFIARMGVISSPMLSQYRKHAFIIIMFVAAIITPPDVMTLILVTGPLYLLYELSIKVVKCTQSNKYHNK